MSISSSGTKTRTLIETDIESICSTDKALRTKKYKPEEQRLEEKHWAEFKIKYVGG
jgi:hypothetical protein